MFSFIEQINLIRYLFVWRVNRSLVRLPKCMPAELSLVLGTIIAERLPTRDARRWKKSLAAWHGYEGKGLNVSVENPPDQPVKKFKIVPEASWPIETVLFTYPGKMSYGQDELIMWELELMGDSADHGFFLEVILPAMEDAGSTTDPRWHHHHSPWGRFDIDAVYVARGRHWEPVVSGGRLDLRYRATPRQWAAGLNIDPDSERACQNLTWITPFDLTSATDFPLAKPSSDDKIPPPERPTVSLLMEALITRLTGLVPGKNITPDDVWDFLTPDERISLRQIIRQGRRKSPRVKDIKPALAYWPGRWIGRQTTGGFSAASIPYLELASILHLGRQTHFGCGTFTID